MSIITRLTFPLVAAAALVMSPMNSHASATATIPTRS